MKILLIDAFDSFVYIIYQYLLELGHEVRVVRIDEIPHIITKGIPEDLIFLGPGPGHPKDCGYVELINTFKDTKKFFGVCLGHQAMGLAFGGEIYREPPVHGVVHEISHTGKGCFTDIPSPMKATRYHSLAIEPDTLPECLTITAEQDGIIMGIKHETLPIEGIQFHPESIGTENGMQLLRNLNIAL